MAIEIIGREQWGALRPRRRTVIDTPSPELWLHHSASNHRGVDGVRQIQRFHMESRPEGRGWSDIAYSFLIDRFSLDIYEGRGAGVLGAHTFGRNSISHGLCVMGNFDVTDPTPPLLDRIAELVAHGHERGWWPAALSGGHRDVRSTRCPGDRLYAQIGEINRRTGGEPNVPTGTNEPSPYDRRVQQALLQLDPDALPEFGADGFIGAESAVAAEQIAERGLADRVRMGQLEQTLRQREAQLGDYKRLAEAAELIRQGIMKLEP